MLDLGFREDLEFILKTTPAEPPHACCSRRRLPRGIVALAKSYQRTRFASRSRATRAAMPTSSTAPSGSPPDEVEHAVVNVLRFHESPSALVFCNTRNAVRHLQATLLERGFSVVALSGELTQSERNPALQALRDGRARVCVATDVAARGIDLPDLDLVIHADLPNDPEVMQHRSGRTGRAGRKGVSVLLVPPARKRRAELLLNLAGIDAVWGTAPTAEEIRKLDQERMLKDALFSEETTPEDLIAGAGPARRTVARGHRRGAGAALSRAAAFAGRHSRSRPWRRPVPRHRRPGKRRPSDARRRSRGRAAVEARKIIAASRRHGGRQRVVSRRHRPQEERRGALAVADDLPPRRHRQARYRRHPHHGHHHRVRDFQGRAAESFAAMIRRPDKEDNIRIEAMSEAPQEQAPQREAVLSAAA